MRRFVSGFLAFVAIVSVCASAAAESESDLPMADVAAVGAVNARETPGAAFVATRPVLSADRAQAASGELAIVNIDAYSYAKDLSTLSFIDLCIRNYRSAAASDVWVEVWASSQIPQIGGNITHLTVATYAFGTVGGYSTRCLNTGAIPMTPPNPGEYRVSIVVYEGSGPGRTLQFIYTDPVKGDFSGPFSSSTLYMEKPIDLYITNSGNNASLQVGRTRNSRTSASGQLKISLIATTGVPRYGPTISFWWVLQKEYSPLSAGYSYTNVDTGSLATTQPPPGTYWITAVLWERATDGVWYYFSIYTFSTRYTFTGTSPAPSADFTFSPTTPLVGQSVSFTDTSTGSPTSWSWSFGNGATSTTRDPTYAYPAAGTPGASLTATNAGGSSTRTKSVMVLVPTPPVITYFGANPSAVVTGQQSILTWTSTRGTAASIDRGVGTVPTSGSIAITPVIGVLCRLTVTGPERIYSIGPRSTRTWSDVLGTMFGR